MSFIPTLSKFPHFWERPPKVGDHFALNYGEQYGFDAWGVYVVAQETNWLGKPTGKLRWRCRAKDLDQATAELWAAASNA